MREVASKRGAGPTTISVLKDAELGIARQWLRHAAVQVALTPVVLAAVAWVCGAPLSHLLVLLEVLLVAGLAASELWRGREASRRNALLLLALNFVIVLGLSAYTNNSIVSIGSGIATIAVALLVWRRRPTVSRLTLALAWLVFGVGLSLLLAVCGWGRLELVRAHEAYLRGDFVAAREALDRTQHLLALRGTSRTELALIEFRRGELAARTGELAHARRHLERCRNLAAELSMPDPAVVGVDGLRLSLGWQLAGEGTNELAARVYAAQAWGEPLELGDDPLAGYRLYDFDGVSWAW